MAKKPEPRMTSPKNVDLSDLMQGNDHQNFLKQMQDDFKNLMSDKPVLGKCIEAFLDEIVDLLTLGIIFDLHRKFKTKAYCLEVEENEEKEDAEESEELPLNPVKTSSQKCVCPNPKCEQQVAALRFARHLAKCMGISDNSRASRSAPRRAATNKEKGESSSDSTHSDDDDDEDWNPRKNRRKDKNLSPKKKGIPKKNSDPDLAEATNVDAKESFDEAKNLRHSSYSPDGSLGSGNTSPKKRDKFKKKSKGKEKSSASTSLNFD